MARAGLRTLRRAWITAALLGSMTPAGAATVNVTVTNVHSDKGEVRAAVCTRAEFLKPTCTYIASAPAHAPETQVRVENVPPGTYAVQVYQDENDNHRIDRNFLGLPTEGMGFSNNAPFRFGPPSFDDAQVELGRGVTSVSIKLRYF